VVVDITEHCHWYQTPHMALLIAVGSILGLEDMIPFPIIPSLSCLYIHTYWIEA
jgi:hypothetical protein